ncbi:TM2 domain-containing protein [Pelomonas sp. CA6]|uniref:TM2 domain-containing protein n=1 Tax=Pelomonas sp. CA6 TaxID=2907999 RepID=UPI001F4C1F1A|nr:TM2 domain-containing protein [Pelomonas sp. CA6]MCH7344993.1 TM2 domain-containing protein [Pelomonas sp. CA6]
MSTGKRSKTVAVWLSFALGSLGVHRFYLHGLRDPWAWLHLPPTLLGLYGVQRMDVLGQDDRLAWVLIPLLGLMLTQSMLAGIVHALTPDERWRDRHNPGQPVRKTGWGPVLGAIACLMVGGGCLMATIAFSAQRYFESQVEAAREISQ